jgi:hypothetical protein
MKLLTVKCTVKIGMCVGRGTLFRPALHLKLLFRKWEICNPKTWLWLLSRFFIWIMIPKSYPHNRPWSPIGLWDVKDPTLSRQCGHRRRKGCQPYAPAAPHSLETLFLCFWYSFLLDAGKPQGLVLPEGLGATTERTPWPESASELYRPIDRRFSAKLVLTFAYRGATSSAWRFRMAVYSAVWTRVTTFSFK